MAALTPWMWLVGFAMLIGAAILFPNPIMLIILLFGGMETWRRWKARKSEEGKRYHEVRPRDRVLVAVTYVGLAVALAVGMDLTFVAAEPERHLACAAAGRGVWESSPMARYAAFLRGINLGPTRRVPMQELRAALEAAGYGGVRTLLQSGNVVLTSDAEPAELEQDLAASLREAFGFDIAVLVRTRDELAEVVASDPFAGVADDPARYQVSFLSAEPDPAGVEELEAVEHRSRARGGPRPRGLRLAPRRRRAFRAGQADHRSTPGRRGHGAQLADGDQGARAGRRRAPADAGSARARRARGRSRASARAP